MSLVRVRLDLGYDGTDFSGWAAQPGQRTVAGVLIEVLHRILGAERVTGLTVAGRTDAGVHATGQVCHIDIAAERWEPVASTMLRRLARLLPPDLRAYTAVEVPPSFDARFSARFRRYEYRVTDLPWGAPPLQHRYTLAWPRPLDEDRLAAAASGLLGEHDFAAYCRRREHASTIRAIERFDWRRDPDGTLVATVQADAFCQAMVRSLIGALLAAGDGRRAVDWPALLLSRQSRADEVAVVPPRGLTLVVVGYPDTADGYAERAAQTRQRRDRA